jgi:hypothetical protein
LFHPFVSMFSRRCSIHLFLCSTEGVPSLCFYVLQKVFRPSVSMFYRRCYFHLFL